MIPWHAYLLYAIGVAGLSYHVLFWADEMESKARSKLWAQIDKLGGKK